VSYETSQTAIQQARPAIRPSARPVRVLIIAPSIRTVGGQSVQAKRLVEAFGREPSLDITFLPINPLLPGPLGRLQEIKYVRTVVTTFCYCLLLLLRARGCDIIHVFSASYWSFLLSPAPAILIARLFGKKVLLNYHSGEAEDHLANWRSALPIVRLAHKVAAPSGYLEEVFGRFGVRAEVVPNTLDLSDYRFRDRHPLRPVLLSNRNLEAIYNVECVLRAFALVQQQRPEAQLIVAGDGSQRAMLLALSQELRLQHVEFRGRIEQTDMPALYDRADLYVNASNIDNMPLSLIEAFSCGLPVVTTNAGGIPFIASHDRTALIVERNDHEAIARGILRLLDDPVLVARMTRAARMECNRYTWSSVRTGWLTLYYALLDRAIPEHA
jgi:L-malate glycosyltransferase